MNKIWKSKHTISAWSHFYANDFPKPFNNTDYYQNVIRNLFKNKDSNELIKIELEHNVSEYCYMSIKIYAPTSKGIYITDIVDVKQFVNWYNKCFGYYPSKHEVNNKIIYSFIDCYTLHNIIISLNQYDNYILITRRTEINKRGDER